MDSIAVSKTVDFGSSPNMPAAPWCNRMNTSASEVEIAGSSPVGVITGVSGITEITADS